MDSIDLEVLKQCRQWVAEGLRCQLVTVIRTWGSSPRPEGATLAICADGRVVGSVSGGCIEDDLIARVRAEGITRDLPEIVTYGITADEAHRFGLPCGGTIELAIEPLSPHSQIDELLEGLERHELVARQLDLGSGAVRLSGATSNMALKLEAGVLTTVHGPRWRLLIIGAGQLSRFLAQIALGMDYRVTVCDPREEYRAGWQVEGVELVHAMPDDLVQEMRLDSRSAVVAVTHDPKLDDLALMEALKSEAFYVGAIGSRLNNQKRRERLVQFDVSQAQLAKLHGPIGLYIGSKTPAEIAISILAEMTAVKNGIVLSDSVRVAGAKQAAESGSALSADGPTRSSAVNVRRFSCCGSGGSRAVAATRVVLSCHIKRLERPMNPIKMLGIVLIIAGALGLVYGGFSYTKDTTALKIGPIELSVKEKETVNIPMWAGIAAIVAGGLMLGMGGRKG